MAGTAYAAAADYAALYPGDETPAAEELAAASRRIDALTFGRIQAAGGFSALSDFRQSLVREATCRLLHFARENADALGAGVSAYAIDGVSLRFGLGPGTGVRGGVVLPGEVKSLLDLSGLTDRTLEAVP